jgi:hypothetical protein
MNYLNHVKASAITLTLFNNIKSRGLISTCHVLKYPNKAGCFWSTKTIKKVKIDNYFTYRTVIQTLCDKYGIPFIPDIKRNDSVTIAHKNILLCHSTFVRKDLEGIIYGIETNQ